MLLYLPKKVRFDIKMEIRCISKEDDFSPSMVISQTSSTRQNSVEFRLLQRQYVGKLAFLCFHNLTCGGR